MAISGPPSSRSVSIYSIIAGVHMDKMIIKDASHGISKKRETRLMDFPEISKYKGLISAQGHRDEIVQDLSTMVSELLESFAKLNRQLPGRIIFYRDGVSEGQFADVLLREMDVIRKAGYLPRVTFIVVQKRQHTHFFPADAKMQDRNGNVLPGTVVDTKICHPSQYDFYLCGHADIQGTNRPTHYHVLFDENYFTADLFQLFTNSLCYTGSLGKNDN